MSLRLYNLQHCLLLKNEVVGLFNFTLPVFSLWRTHLSKFKGGILQITVIKTSPRSQTLHITAQSQQSVALTTRPQGIIENSWKNWRYCSFGQEEHKTSCNHGSSRYGVFRQYVCYFTMKVHSSINTEDE